MTEARDLAGKEAFAQNMKLLVAGMARALVDQPDNVVVELVTDERGTTIRLQVAPGDIGKVIGKQGRTARSLRTILGAASMKSQLRFALDITDEASHTPD